HAFAQLEAPGLELGVLIGETHLEFEVGGRADEAGLAQARGDAVNRLLLLNDEGDRLAGGAGAGDIDVVREGPLGGDDDGSREDQYCSDLQRLDHQPEQTGLLRWPDPPADGRAPNEGCMI